MVGDIASDRQVNEIAMINNLFVFDDIKAYMQCICKVLLILNAYCGDIGQSPDVPMNY